MVSIIIPAFNEAGRLPANLGKIAKVGAGYEWKWEVIIVVEKSADGTLELARKASVKQENFRVIGHGARRGHGFAVHIQEKDVLVDNRQPPAKFKMPEACCAELPRTRNT